MEKTIEFWDRSYQKRHFVRWIIIDRSFEALIGTVEMFQRLAADEFNHFGVLRFDLQSEYEKQEYIEAILAIANEHFYSDFAVESILTKAIPAATERILALKNQGYVPLKRQFMICDDYFMRKQI
jgi:ribosomal-protein-alanine N-acetyltransferase